MKTVTKFITTLFILIITANTISPVTAYDNESNIEWFSPYYGEQTIHDEILGDITMTLVNGPSEAPGIIDYEIMESNQLDATIYMLEDFPSYSWVYGCSAVSAAMIAAWQDRNGYENLYTGPSNNGVAPVTDTGWPFWLDQTNRAYRFNPLVASKMGLDNRTERGTIDNYWVSVNSTAPDPFVTNGWDEHSPETVGDFMGTSQRHYLNNDGWTVFFFGGSNDTGLLNCNQLESNPAYYRDGTLGRKRYYEAKGYQVTKCFNARTNHINGGPFSFGHFVYEINHGNPVFIHLQGHSVVGYGYTSNGKILIRDTWSSDPDKIIIIPWGGTYQGMVMLGASVIEIKNEPGASQPEPIESPLFELWLPLIKN
jgi:hypothetical protein